MEILDLPEEVLLLIFSYVPLYNLFFSVQQTCLAWRDLCFHHSLWGTVHYSQQIDEKLTEEELLSVLKSVSRGLQHLVFEKAFQHRETDFSFLKILKCILHQDVDVSNISSLKIPSIPNGYLEPLVDKCSGLSSIEVSYYYAYCSNGEFFVTMKKLPHLKEFKITESSKCIETFAEPAFHQNRFNEMLADMFSGLLELEVVHIASVNKLYDSTLCALLDTCKNMKELALYGCDGISNVGFQSLPEKSGITSLHLNSTSVNDKGMEHICRSCPGLRNVSFAGCMYVTDISIKHLCTHCPNLESLCVSDPEIFYHKSNITDGGLDYLSQNSHALRSLTMCNSAQISDLGLDQLARSCCNLMQLDVSGCLSVSDNTLQVLAQHCHHLQTVNFSECVHLTGKGINPLVTSCKWLKTLNVANCPFVQNLNFEAFDQIETPYDRYLKGKKELSNCPDKLNGFCANKSTAVFMDVNSKHIIHLEIGDSREVGRHSPKMERLLIERGLNYILNVSPYVVWEIISDASRNIISMMRTDPFKHLQHSLHIWHKAKKLAFLLGEIAKKAANKDLLPWIRPIINHFWYCCSASKGNVEKLLKKWFGILHHVTNQHIWPGGRCHHTENNLESLSSNRKWLHRNSSALQELRKAITNRDWCGSMAFYVNCRQTWAIENFFSHTLLHYVPKRVSYSYDSYTIRNMLAVMDHNNHLHRLPQVTESGLPYVYSHFSRKTKQWVAYEKKSIKEYSYIPDDNGRVTLAADPELVEENNPENSTQTCDNSNHKTYEKSEMDRTRARANFLNALTCSSIPSPKVHSELRFLNLGLCSKVTDHCLRQIAMYCPDLRELDIKGCFNTTDLGISYIARGCQGLKLLNISSGSMIQKMCLTDQSLVSIATHCKGLRQLFIEKNPLMSLDGYKNLFDHCSLPCTVSLTTKSPEILKTDILSMDSSVNSCKRVNVFCRGCYKGNIYHLDVLLYNSDGHILE